MIVLAAVSQTKTIQKAKVRKFPLVHAIWIFLIPGAGRRVFVTRVVSRVDQQCPGRDGYTAVVSMGKFQGRVGVYEAVLPQIRMVDEFTADKIRIRIHPGK